MVIQSSVLRVILKQDIPFVYPNYECTQMGFFLTILSFGFWTILFEVPFAKNPFNISFVKVLKHVISKSNTCDNNFWPL